ncbi:MAG: hypothetical protein AAFW69_07550 [Pseudomonadota bacterium]
MGDLVVLTAGSMRMAVEATDEGMVDCVWCHEGKIGRDRFDARLLRKWEHHGEGESRGKPGGGKPYGGDRPGGGRKYEGGGGPGGKGGPRGGDRGGDDRPRKTGWDGKPREKTHFRKD